MRKVKQIGPIHYSEPVCEGEIVRIIDKSHNLYESFMIIDSANDNGVTGYMLYYERPEDKIIFLRYDQIGRGF